MVLTTGGKGLLQTYKNKRTEYRQIRLLPITERGEEGWLTGSAHRQTGGEAWSGETSVGRNKEPGDTLNILPKIHTFCRLI